MIFNDETLLPLWGCLVNKHNFWICGGFKPEAILNTFLYSKKFIVWCGLHADGIVEPYLFKTRLELTSNVTINGERDKTKIRECY